MASAYLQMILPPTKAPTHGVKLLMDGAKVRLNTIAAKAPIVIIPSRTIVDDALNTSSTNPVQNAAVANAIDDINNRLGESSVSDQIAAYAAPISHTHNYAGSSSAGGAATSAEKLSTARAITLSGAVNGSANFDGSGDANIPTTFPENITVPGTITANKVIGAVYM